MTSVARSVADIVWPPITPKGAGFFVGRCSAGGQLDRHQWHAGREAAIVDAESTPDESTYLSLGLHTKASTCSASTLAALAAVMVDADVEWTDAGGKVHHPSSAKNGDGAEAAINQLRTMPAAALIIRTSNSDGRQAFWPLDRTIGADDAEMVLGAMKARVAKGGKLDASVYLSSQWVRAGGPGCRVVHASKKAPTCVSADELIGEAEDAVVTGCKREPRKPGRTRPGDWANLNPDVLGAELLSQGWTGPVGRVRELGNGATRTLYKHPRASYRWSAELLVFDDGVMFQCWSGNTDFEQGQWVDAVGALMVLRGEDSGQVAKWLAAKPECRAWLDEDRGKEVSDLSGVRVPFPEFDETALYGLAGDMVRLLTPNSESHPAAILTVLMTLCGASIGTGPHYVIGNARHHTNLFVCLVGDTAKGRKSQSIEDASWPMTIADEGFIENRVRSGFGSGEAFVDEVADPVKDEKGELASGSYDRRLVIVEHEFATILGPMHREASTLSTKIRDAYDGRTLRVNSRGKKATATTPHVAIVGAITREELASTMTTTDAANGFANRFLWIATKRTKSLPFGGDHDREAVARLSIKLMGALATARPIGELTWSKSARPRWAELYDQMGSDTTGGMVGRITARAESITLRLSVLFAVLDGNRKIEGQHLEAAWALWRYARASAEWIWAESTGNVDADKFLAAVTAAGPAGVGRDESRTVVFGHNVDAAKIQTAVALLLQLGHIVETKRPTPGRPATVYVRPWHITSDKV